MSIDTSQTPTVINCDLSECDEYGYRFEFHDGKYCSNLCKWRATGRGAVATGLRFEHTRCWTCLAELKEIEPAKPEEQFTESGAELTFDPEEGRVTVEKWSQEETADAACGFQHLTPSAAIGQKDVGRLVRTGTICGECGTTRHTTHTPYLAEGHRTAARLVEYLWENDDVDDVDPETLHRAYAHTGDLELAAGAAQFQVVGPGEDAEAFRERITGAEA